MNRSRRGFRKEAVYFLCLVLMSGCLRASATEAGKTRILLTFGGHGFQEEPFFAMFDSMPGVEYTRAEMPASADLLKPGLEKEYDVVVMYDMAMSMSAEQRKAFVALLETGIGVVALHHHLGAHRDWDEYRGIIGGQYLFKGQKLDGKEYGKSTFAHGQDVDVAVADSDHPVTRGITGFRIHDETYKGCYVSPDVRVLLTTDHPKSNRELAWVTRYGKSPVLYMMLGHDSKAWQHPAYPKLLLNGIRWASARTESRRVE